VYSILRANFDFGEWTTTETNILCTAFCELILTLVNGLPQKLTFPYKYSNKTSRTLCKFISKVAAAKVTKDSTTIAFFGEGRSLVKKNFISKLVSHLNCI
jgi:hypothetical protein